MTKKKRRKKRVKAEAIIVSKVKILCPECEGDKFENIHRYDLSEIEGKGPYVFHRYCSKCGTEVINYRDI